jgi:sporulation protein YlmC with PRC-barrel domain
MAEVGNLADWRGKLLIDRDGGKIGKLEDVYVDVESDEPVFGTVKEGFITGRHLTFVPLQGAVVSPDGLQVRVSKDQSTGCTQHRSRGRTSATG